jgi:hypothetical protein
LTCRQDELLVEALDVLEEERAKIPWQKVGEWIADHGGTYRFGGATCSKRWKKLQATGKA